MVLELELGLVLVSRSVEAEELNKAVAEVEVEEVVAGKAMVLEGPKCIRNLH